MTSKACCTIPPVVSDTDAYTVKGSYSILDGMRTYVSGSPTSKTGVLVVYDIFGLDFKQTLQGCDIMSSSGGREREGEGRLVVMPDLFRGEPMDIKNYPPDTPEKQQKLSAFFGSKAAPAKNVEAVRNLVPLLSKSFPSVERWALTGYCWGAVVPCSLSPCVCVCGLC
jgi:dienelactone hydrolase